MGIGSAFWGAAFAFIFIWLAETITRFHERSLRHQRALAQLERLCNDQLAALFEASAEIDHMRAAFDQGIKDGRRPYLINRPALIPIDFTFELELANMDLINDVLTHRHAIKRINSDTTRLAGALDALQSSLLAGGIERAEYITNLEAILVWQSQIQKYIKATLAETEVLTAKSRVRARRDYPRIERLLLKLRRTQYEPEFDTLVGVELSKLRSEITQVVSASEIRRDRIEKA